MEDLLALHRKQLRDLTALTTQKKKSASKKTRRGVNDECERLEHELKERQQKEVEELNGVSGVTTNGHDREAASQDDVEIDKEPQVEINGDAAQTPPLENTEASSIHTPTTPGKKRNRQKDRLARRAANLDAIASEAASEVALQPNLNAIESASMNALFTQHSLREIQIAPDGHCLYSAFASSLTPPLTYRDTRSAAAAYITSHPDDFAPFLEEGETVESHARKVGQTAEWGGEMELLALSKRYAVAVKVVQAQGVGVTTLNEEDEEKGVVWLAYRRKGYGLGEHYNTLRKI